jgi:excisionase family DNA binding protein
MGSRPTNCPNNDTNINMAVEARFRATEVTLTSEARELSAREAARRLGVGLSHLYQLLWAGKMPGRKENGEWLIPERAVEARLLAKQHQ